jgi:hypothetical protein
VINDTFLLKRWLFCVNIIFDLTKGGFDGYIKKSEKLTAQLYVKDKVFECTKDSTKYIDAKDNTDLTEETNKVLSYKR